MIKIELAEKEVNTSIEILSGLFFSILVATWAIADFKVFKKEAVFGYGLLLILFWPITLIYHLAVTRGIDGITSYLGFWALYMAPFFFGLYAYSYHT